jgi:hypothetical protein
MAKAPEVKVKDQIKKYLTSIGAWWCMPIGTGWGRAGIPDFLVCWRGFFFAIEVKAPGKRGNTTTMQERELAGVKDAMGVAVVVDDVEQLKPIFGEQ